MLQCFGALPTKLYPESESRGPYWPITNRYPIFRPRLLASFATKMADEQDLVVVDEQPESQKGKKKGTKEKRVWKDSKVETLSRCPVQ